VANIIADLWNDFILYAFFMDTDFALRPYAGRDAGGTHAAGRADAEVLPFQFTGLADPLPYDITE